MVLSARSALSALVVVGWWQCSIARHRRCLCGGGSGGGVLAVLEFACRAVAAALDAPVVRVARRYG